MTNEKIKDIGQQDVIDVNISEDLLDEMVAIISQVIEDGAPIQVLILSVVGAYVADRNIGRDIRISHKGGSLFLAVRDGGEDEPRVTVVNQKMQH